MADRYPARAQNKETRLSSGKRAFIYLLPIDQADGV